VADFAKPWPYTCLRLDSADGETVEEAWTMTDLATHLADVKKYTGSVDEAAVAGMAKTYALVLSKADSRWVAASDPAELGRVRDNFLKKKLGLKDADATLDAAIKAVVDKLKADRTKSRLTVYYLLAEHFKKLDLFKK